MLAFIGEELAIRCESISIKWRCNGIKLGCLTIHIDELAAIKQLELDFVFDLGSNQLGDLINSPRSPNLNASRSN